MHCRMFSSILGFYPLDAGSTLLDVIIVFLFIVKWRGGGVAKLLQLRTSGLDNR